MAVIFCDGFDWYQGGAAGGAFTGDLGRRWTSLTGSGNTLLIGSAYARPGGVGQGLRVSASNTGSLQKSFAANYTDGVVGLAFYFDIASLASRTICVVSDGGTEQISIRTNASSVLTVTRNATLLATGTTVLSTTTWYYVELKFTIHASTGVVELKLNGASEIASTTSLNTRNTANTQWNGIAVPTANAITFWIDDLYVLDPSTGTNTTFLGPVQVIARYPAGNGATVAWTPNGGSNFGSVSELLEDGDTSFNQSSTANQVDTFTMQDLPAASGSVFALAHHMVAKQDGGAARSIAPVMRPASTDRVGTTVNLSTSYQILTQMYDTSPETSAAWDVAGANSLEAGYKLVS